MSAWFLARSLRGYRNVLPNHCHFNFVQAILIRSQQQQAHSNTWKKPGAEIRASFDIGAWASIPEKKKPISIVDFRRPEEVMEYTAKPTCRTPLDALTRLASGTDSMAKKHALDHSGKIAQRKAKKQKRVVDSVNGRPWTDASNEEIIELEVQELLQTVKTNGRLVADDEEQASPQRQDVPDLQVQENVNGHPDAQSETRATQQSQTQPAQQVEQAPPLELRIAKTSSTGDGLAYYPQTKLVYAVPFAIEGDTVLARPFGKPTSEHWRRTDFVKVVKPSPLRDDSRIQCKYFAACGGCQLQMMSQEDQLEHKKEVVQRAYAAFSNMNPKLVPQIEDTLPSPLQYNYRTKLTPHFDGPPGMSRRRKSQEPKPKHTSRPNIGFNLKNQRKIIDIEECPIGTKAVNYGMKKERNRIEKHYDQYAKGATILLRETTERVKKPIEVSLSSFDAADVTETESYYEVKNCVTVNNDSVQEYVKDILFVNNANSFFQNNNSILSPFLDYIKDCLFSEANSPSDSDGHKLGNKKPKYLVDAYCGSGLFTVTLAKYFEKSIGVDIDPMGIHYASLNAQRNGISPENARFKAANAAEIFNNIDFPPDETVMIIDPPRKGCDLGFLNQLLRFGPERIVYVSCNVHTQARDVGFLSRGVPSKDGGPHLRYDLQSLRGCDFFPQTAHVEGVAILRRRRGSRSNPSSPSPSVGNKAEEIVQN